MLNKCFHITPLAQLLFICLEVVPVPPTEGARYDAPPAAASMVPGCLFMTLPACLEQGKTGQDLSGDV